MARRAGSGGSRLWRQGVSGWLALALALLASAPVLAQEGGPRRAGLVVVHGDGRSVIRCVTFDEERITGVALLQQSGLALIANAGPTGSTICKLDGEGCSETDCFCKCKGTPCFYWNYYHMSDGAWTYSGMGAAARTLGDGDVDAWVWSDGNTPPPALTFADICPAGDATSAPTEAAPTAEAATSAPTETAPAAEVTAGPATATPEPATSTTTPRPATPTSTPPASPTPAPAMSTTSPSPTPTPAIATTPPSATGSPPALSPAPTLPAKTAAVPTATAIPSAAEAENRGGYAVFGLLLLVLGGGYFIAQRRRV